MIKKHGIGHKCWVPGIECRVKKGTKAQRHKVKTGIRFRVQGIRYKV